MSTKQALLISSILIIVAGVRLSCFESEGAERRTNERSSEEAGEPTHLPPPLGRLLAAPPARALQSLTPLDDAYCEGGAGADTNFGASTRLVSKSSTATNLDHTRKCWLKFDVSSRPNAIPSASLSLTSRDTRSENGVGPHVLRLYGLRDGLDGWSEDSITWNNAPGNETSTRYLDGSTAALLDLRWVPQIVGDEAVELGGPKLGGFIQDDQDGLVTLVVLMEPLSSSTEYYGFHSKEGAAPPSLDLHSRAAPSAHALPP